MIIRETMEFDGKIYDRVYEDADSFDHLDASKCRQVYGVCFCEGKIVLGYRGKKDTWGIIGGTIEEGETFTQTLNREIKEEANMEIIKELPLGYMTIREQGNDVVFYQLRYACLVRPFGPFISDPDGSITKIALIEAKDYKQYFDWAKVGDRLIERALELYEHKLINTTR